MCRWRSAGRGRRGGSFRLPLDLTLAGMPGCTLLASIDLLFPLDHRRGLAICMFPIPNDPTLLGARFYNQALVPDPAANPLGLVVSNGAAGVIGRR